MKLLQLLQTCFQSLARNRLRSLLTSLGIIIGAASVIVMMAIGEGSQKLIDERIAAMGTNLLQIMPQHQYGARGSATPNLKPAQLTMADLEKVHAEAAYVSAVSGLAQGSFTAQGPSGSGTITVTGVENDYLFIKNRSLQSGSLFDEDDLLLTRRVAIIGTTTAQKLLGTADGAVGKTIQVGSGIFTVKGVLKPAGTSGGRDQDDLFWIPLETFQVRLSGTGTLESIAVSVRTKALISKAEQDLSAIIREAHGLTAGQANDFSIMNSADALSVASSTAKTMTTLLASIAAVSLLVGGIGIMNIMLVSVTERTREIGILMSIGANKRDILLQFLSESVVLSLAGGVIGIVFALIACRVLNTIDVFTVVNAGVIVLAAGFSALVGIFFGFYPARKAASLYPIDALRYE
ncbi:ABC transporter permease [Breznakiella homolactica]|uniref:ABC transporter permease n=1 Tax=Breznakiella homolactica TaxID=2798577 RepID=A0A7T7XLV6_9SPIR|nr:ABC transporter permease [Breznakiella homolactica]QQO08710.1 ABC transporter permease [Breznakiella homolactica]